MDTYGNDLAKDMTLSKLREMMRDKGVERLFVKKLAPNDNSKNQLYFGGDYSSLNVIPTGEIKVVESTSTKKIGGREKSIFRTSVNLSWLSPEGQLHPAPNAKLILYPQYPEVRFSGFLSGSKVKIGPWMDPYKKGRSEGRTLILGVVDEGTVIGYFVPPDYQLNNEISKAEIIGHESVFSELSLTDKSSVLDKKHQMLDKFREIYNKGWIQSKRLNGAGDVLPCTSSNCGGYTLEAELGITPNGYSEPDYLGWEVKQFGVTDFNKVNSKVITLMTPEPSGGVYKEDGVAAFLNKFGYEDLRGREDRINFGGVHRCNQTHARTNLTLKLQGFNGTTQKIADPDGGIILESSTGEIAAKWHFSKILEHWKKKHNQAVYVPSMIRNGFPNEYHYGNTLMLGEGTDFSLLLQAISNTSIYYDPGIKMEQASTSKPKIKRRSQFRVKSGNLSSLYKEFTLYDLGE